MKAMKFDVECVRRCLVESGVVYTVRGYEMKDGLVLVDGVGVCRRKRLGEVVRKEDLEKFVELSGFASVEEWWKKIEGFIWRGERRKWLYEVKWEKEITEMYTGGDQMQTVDEFGALRNLCPCGAIAYWWDGKKSVCHKCLQRQVDNKRGYAFNQGCTKVISLKDKYGEGVSK